MMWRAKRRHAFSRIVHALSSVLLVSENQLSTMRIVVCAVCSRHTRTSLQIEEQTGNIDTCHVFSELQILNPNVNMPGTKNDNTTLILVMG
jgi:hypothetical protein